MSQIFFKLFIVIATLLRLPLSLVFVLLRPFVPFVKKRLNFERKNLGAESSLSFSFDNINADYCFEVSSEGELEQVRSLMEEALKRSKKIEILFSSESVETKCLQFYQNYPSQVRLLRLPLLSASIVRILYFQSVWQWVSAPTIVFCRYDLFPELLMLGLFGKKLILVSGAFKKMSWYKKESFKMFAMVVAATDLEKENFQHLLSAKSTVYSCDFRVPRIGSRLLAAQETLAKKSSLTQYLEKIKSEPVNQKIIFGSVWRSDLEILNNKEFISKVKNQEMNLLFVPHKLDEDFVQGLRQEIQNYFGPENVTILKEGSTYGGESVVILQMSGVLCELYSLFNVAYVGGGYERSIHSVLEPFFCNNIVITGPKINRSTEIDLVREVAPREIHVLNRADSFYTIVQSIDFDGMDFESRKRFITQSQQEMKIISSELLG